MKREAFDHAKIRLLARDLKLPMAYARGVLESLWLVTGINYPRGDVGRMTNEMLAVAIGAPDDMDADHLVASLVKRCFLEEIPGCRLYVHDWHEHADDAIQRRVARAVDTFANGAMPQLGKLSGGERAKIEESYRGRPKDASGRPDQGFGRPLSPHLPPKPPFGPNVGAPTVLSCPVLPCPEEEKEPRGVQTDLAGRSDREPEEDSSRKKKISSKEAAGAWFDSEFWPLWPKHPRKTDRAKCREKLAGIATTPEAREAIIAGLRAWLASQAWADQEGKFIPLPMTWINGRRWEDDPVPAKSNGHGPTGKWDDEDIAKFNREWGIKEADDDDGRDTTAAGHPEPWALGHDSEEVAE